MLGRHVVEACHAAGIQVNTWTCDDPERMAELLEWGTWTLESDVLTLVPDAQSPTCADVIGVYQLDVTDDGTRIDVTVQDDTCDGRSSDVSMGLTQAGS